MKKVLWNAGRPKPSWTISSRMSRCTGSKPFFSTSCPGVPWKLTNDLSPTGSYKYKEETMMCCCRNWRRCRPPWPPTPTGTPGGGPSRSSRRSCNTHLLPNPSLWSPSSTPVSSRCRRHQSLSSTQKLLLSPPLLLLPNMKGLTQSQLDHQQLWSSTVLYHPATCIHRSPLVIMHVSLPLLYIGNRQVVVCLAHKQEQLNGAPELVVSSAARLVVAGVHAMYESFNSFDEEKPKPWAAGLGKRP